MSNPNKKLINTIEKESYTLGNLYIVATPIGNLEDITLRAVKTLSEVDIILAEDTRVTVKLLSYVSNLQLKTYNLKPNAKLLSYHQHSGEEKKLEILKILMDGKNVALVTDAGTPGISDPGNELIEYLLNYLPELKVVPIPGASAVSTALSASGFNASEFLFLGFWPKKKASKLVKLIRLIGKEIKTIAFYESPFRIIKTLNLLEKEFGSNAKIVVARELTKLHETMYRGTIGEVIAKLQSDTIKGEIVVSLSL